MKTLGSTLIVVGSIIWFGGELVSSRSHMIGQPIFGVGAILYFLGKRNSREPRPTSQQSGRTEHEARP